MARFRSGGYIFECWVGDHLPRHFHVYDDKGRFMGRYNIEKMEPIGDWTVSPKVKKIIENIVIKESLI